MSKKLNALRQERNVLVTQARDLLNKADAEKRELSAEETGKYDELMEEQNKRADAITREERQIEVERSLSAVEIESASDKSETRGEGTASKEYRTAFETLIRAGKDALSADEIRSLSAGKSTEGGYMVLPQEMVSELLKAMDNATFMRQSCRKWPLATAASLGVVSLDADPADADWTAELLTGSEDSTMAFGKRELSPKPLAKLLKVSNKLIRSVSGVENIITSRMAYKFGITQEQAFLTGTGANQPLGVFTASASGVTTARDVSTGNATTAFTLDGLINAKYSLKAQYQRTAKWLFHRDAVKMLAKLKDGDGQYMWQPSKQVADPDMLLGNPVYISEYAPNTFTTGLYVGLLGDFSYYWIADALDMQMQRLNELYAATNQVGFIGRMESDGMPVLAEAFARVKLG